MNRLIIVLCIFTMHFMQMHSLVPFKQVGETSYQDLIVQANKNDLAALQALNDAWASEAAKFKFISKYLTKNGYSKAQVEAKLIALTPEKPAKRPVTPVGNPDLLGAIKNKQNQNLKPIQRKIYANLADLEAAQNKFDANLFQDEAKQLKIYINDIKEMIDKKTRSDENITELINALLGDIKVLSENRPIVVGAKRRIMNTNKDRFKSLLLIYEGLINPEVNSDEDDEWEVQSQPVPAPRPHINPKPVVVAPPTVNEPAKPAYKPISSILDKNEMLELLENVHIKKLKQDEQDRIKNYIEQLFNLNQRDWRFKEGQKKLSEFLNNLTSEKALKRYSALNVLNSRAGSIEDLIRIL